MTSGLKRLRAVAAQASGSSSASRPSAAVKSASSSARKPVTAGLDERGQAAPGHRHDRGAGGQRLADRGAAGLLPADGEQHRPGPPEQVGLPAPGHAADPAGPVPVELRRDVVEEPADVGVAAHRARRVGERGLQSRAVGLTTDRSGEHQRHPGRPAGAQRDVDALGLAQPGQHEHRVGPLLRRRRPARGDGHGERHGAEGLPAQRRPGARCDLGVGDTGEEDPPPSVEGRVEVGIAPQVPVQRVQHGRGRARRGRRAPRARPPPGACAPGRTAAPAAACRPISSTTTCACACATPTTSGYGAARRANWPCGKAHTRPSASCSLSPTVARTTRVPAPAQLRGRAWRRRSPARRSPGAEPPATGRRP